MDSVFLIENHYRGNEKKIQEELNFDPLAIQEARTLALPTFPLLEPALGINLKRLKRRGLEKRTLSTEGG